MGLDGVELVMSFEEAFGIELKDEEVTETRTPRMVIDLIVSKLRTAEERICRSQRVFYTIRRVLIEALGLERKSISPDMRFRDWIPPTQERDVWERMRAALSPRSWPSLVRPRWLSRSLIAVGYSIFVMTVLLAICLSLSVWLGIAGGVFLAIVFAVIAAGLTRRYRICIPTGLQSIRDLIPYAVTSERMSGWTRDDVAVVVKRLTMDQLGVEEAAYTEDSRFVEDFHMG